LPLEWLSFEAIRQENGIELMWVTLKESNVSHFVIEKSYDGKYFFTIHNYIPARNGAYNSYEYNDKENVNTISYYRIRQVDHNYNYSYSKIIKVSDPEDIEFQIYPNPAKESFEVMFTSIYNEEIEIFIYNIYNHEVKAIKLGSGENNVLINTQSWARGSYIVKALKENKSCYKKMILF
jgi:hypothetical protein